jgi:hypothetical protein
MSHRNVGSKIEESLEAKFLRTKTKGMRGVLKKIASKGDASFKPLLKYVARQVNGKRIEGKPVFHHLMSQFDQYQSIEEINQNIDTLQQQWTKECYLSKDKALIESGRLLLETYRYYFIQAFYNKIQFLSSSSSPSPVGALEAKELPSDFVICVQPVIETVKNAKLAAVDSPVKQWMDQPFESLHDFKPVSEFPIDISQLLDQVKKLQSNIKKYNDNVTLVSQDIEKKEIDLSSIDSIMSEERRLSDLMQRRNRLEYEKNDLFKRREELIRQIKSLHPYFVDLELKENKHKEAFDRYVVFDQTSTEDFNDAFNQSKEAKQLDDELAIIEKGRARKAKYYDAKTENIVSLKPKLILLRQQIMDFNAQYNDVAKGKDISAIFAEMNKSVDFLLTKVDGEHLVAQQEAEMFALETAVKLNADNRQKEKSRLCVLANTSLIHQIKQEALGRRQKCFETYIKTAKELVSLPEVSEIASVTKTIADAEGHLSAVRKKLLEGDFAKYKMEFDGIKALPPDVMLPLSDKEIKLNPSANKESLEAHFKACIVKQKKLKQFLDSARTLCESWGGVFDEEGRLLPINALPSALREFHQAVENYLLEIDQQIKRSKQTLIVYEIQCRVSEFKTDLLKIKHQHTADSTVRYAKEVLQLQILQEKIHLYVKAKKEEDKEVVAQSTALDAIDDSVAGAKKNALDNHARIWNKKIIEEFNEFDAKINVQIAKIIANPVKSEEKGNVLRKLASVVYEQGKSKKASLANGIDEELSKELKEDKLVIAVKEQLAKDPKHLIDYSYGGLQQSTAHRAFQVESNEYKLLQPAVLRPRPIPPTWSTGKFVLGLVLGLVGGLLYWCSYRSEKAQYDREMQTWSALNRQEVPRFLRVGGGTTSTAYAPAMGNGVLAQSQPEVKPRESILPLGRSAGSSAVSASSSVSAIEPDHLSDLDSSRRSVVSSSMSRSLG